MKFTALHTLQGGVGGGEGVGFKADHVDYPKSVFSLIVASQLKAIAYK